MAQPRQVRSYGLFEDAAFAFEDCPSGSHWDLPQLARLEIQHESGFDIQELLSYNTRPPPNGKLAQLLKSKTNLPWPQIIDRNADFAEASFYARLHNLVVRPIPRSRKVVPKSDAITPLPFKSMIDRSYTPRAPAKDQPRRPEGPKSSSSPGQLVSPPSNTQASHSHTNSESSDISLESSSRMGKDGPRAAPVVRNMDKDNCPKLHQPVKFKIERPLQRQGNEEVKLGSSPTGGSVAASSETESEYSFHAASLKYSSGNEEEEEDDDQDEEDVRLTAIALSFELADALKEARRGLKIRISDPHPFTFYIEAGQMTTKPDVTMFFEQAGVGVFTECKRAKMKISVDNIRGQEVSELIGMAWVLRSENRAEKYRTYLISWHHLECYLSRLEITDAALEGFKELREVRIPQRPVVKQSTILDLTNDDHRVALALLYAQVAIESLMPYDPDTAKALLQ